MSAALIEPGDPYAGTTLVGKYHITELIGVGAMGRVYRADHLQLDAQVAVKLLSPDVATDAQTVKRFQTEARAASRLRHPNTIQVHDFGQSDTGILFLVMELLRGRNLAQIIGDEPPLVTAAPRRPPRPGAGGARRGARRRRGAPRLQAGEHLRRDAAHRQRARQGARLRHRQAARRGRRQPDLARRRLRHARLHEPRADPRRGARRALRRIRGGRRPLRGDDRHAALRQRRAAHRRAHVAPQPGAAAAGAATAGPVDPARARARLLEGARQEPRASLPLGRRDEAGDGVGGARHVGRAAASSAGRRCRGRRASAPSAARCCGRPDRSRRCRRRSPGRPSRAPPRLPLPLVGRDDVLQRLEGLEREALVARRRAGRRQDRRRRGVGGARRGALPQGGRGRRRSVGGDDAVVSGSAGAGAAACRCRSGRRARSSIGPARSIRRIARASTSCSASAARPRSCRSTCGGASAWRRRCSRFGARMRRWCSRTSTATTRRRAASSASSSCSRAQRRCWRRRPATRCSTSRSRWCACRRSIRWRWPIWRCRRAWPIARAAFRSPSSTSCAALGGCRSWARRRQALARRGGASPAATCRRRCWRRRPGSPTSGARSPS